MQEQFGHRIRESRKSRGWTLAELGRKCGLSPAFLSQVERGLGTPSIVSLVAISKALGTSLAELIEAEPRAQNVPSRLVTRVGSRLQFSIQGWSVSYEYVSGSFPGRAVDLILSSIPPGHLHESEPHRGEEFGYVLEGDFIIRIGDKEYLLHPGDSYHFPSNTRHAYATPRDRGAKVLWGMTEDVAEGLESMVRRSQDVGLLLTRGK